MGKILRFPVECRVPANGLEDQECGTVYAAACLLIAQRQATSVSIAHGNQYVGVRDRYGNPHFIGRVDCICYLFDHETFVIAQSIRFEVVLYALLNALSGSDDTADLANVKNATS